MLINSFMMNMLPRNFISLLYRRGYGAFQTKAALVNSYSSTTDKTQVVVADEGRTIVCWHPEPEFPYEHTLPLPEEIKRDVSVLKSINDVDRNKDFSHLESLKEEFARQELMKMTFTTKHRWFPRLQKRRAKKTPMDRPYL